jgi:potassium uptake TrkH family protein
MQMLDNYRDEIKRVLDITLVLTGIVSLISFIAVIGFFLNDYWNLFFQIVSKITVSLFVIQEIIRWFIAQNINTYAKTRVVENIIALIVFLQAIFPYSSLELLSYFMHELSLTELSLFFISISQLAVLLSIFLRSLRYNSFFSKISLHAGAIITISFILVIAIGTLMLMLPRAVTEGKEISFVDALFTSTSAVCVTGLVVVDTSSYFSGIGKLIIISLIQIGGLGLMTLTTFFAILFAGSLSVRVKVFMKDLLSQESINEGMGLLKKIFLFTFLVEYLGSFLLYFALGGELVNFDKEVYYKCLFHSISAFCNAGFSVYADNFMYHTIRYNYIYLSVIISLIVLGGIGFFTMADVFRNPFRRANRYKIKTSSKIILITTFLLITGGALVIFIFESDITIYKSVGDRFFQSLFLSVTARTAGYNSVAIELLSPATVMILIILMWIGASPGSTGGGIKTTTFAVAIITLYNLIRGKERIEVFNREIFPDNIKQSMMVIVSSLLFLGFSTTLLVWIEPKLNPLDLIFEATSAISTVGLSRNITMILSPSSKIILTILMIVGRIGVFTFFLSLHKPKPEPRFRLPLEKIMIG